MAHLEGSTHQMVLLSVWGEGYGGQAQYVHAYGQRLRQNSTTRLLSCWTQSSVFQQYIPSLGKTSRFFQGGTRLPAYLPIDLATSKTMGHVVYALQEAKTFPSDQPHLASVPSVWNRTMWPHSFAVTHWLTSPQPPTRSSAQLATRRAPCSG